VAREDEKHAAQAAGSRRGTPGLAEGRRKGAEDSEHRHGPQAARWAPRQARWHASARATVAADRAAAEQEFRGISPEPR